MLPSVHPNVSRFCPCVKATLYVKKIFTQTTILESHRQDAAPVVVLLLEDSETYFTLKVWKLHKIQTFLSVYMLDGFEGIKCKKNIFGVHGSPVSLYLKIQALTPITYHVRQLDCPLQAPLKATS